MSRPYQSGRFVSVCTKVVGLCGRGTFRAGVFSRIICPVLLLSACTTISQGVAVLTHSPHKDAASAPAGLYHIDPDHVSVHFSVMHLGYSAFTGRFDNIDAVLTFHPDDPTQSTLLVTIMADSVNSGSPAIDKAIANDLLNAQKHPELRFTAAHITLDSENSGTINGMLDLAGTSHPLSLHTRFNGGAKNPLTGLYTLGFSADAQLDRRDWGLGDWIPAVAKDVTLHIEAEFVRSDTPLPKAQ